MVGAEDIDVENFVSYGHLDVVVAVAKSAGAKFARKVAADEVVEGAEAQQRGKLPMQESCTPAEQALGSSSRSKV